MRDRKTAGAVSWKVAQAALAAARAAKRIAKDASKDASAAAAKKQAVATVKKRAAPPTKDCATYS